MENKNIQKCESFFTKEKTLYLRIIGFTLLISGIILLLTFFIAGGGNQTLQNSVILAIFSEILIMIVIGILLVI
jgi:hypothetical protein